MAVATRARAAKPRRPSAALREARAGLYREAILGAAERLIAARGFEKVRMETIAEEAGLALGTVYSVFRGKRAIVDALHEARVRDIMERTAARADGLSDPLALLAAGVRVYVEYFLAHPDYLRMYLAEGSNWGNGAALADRLALAAAWEEGVARSAQLFARGIVSGIFYEGEPRRMARTMVAMQQVRLAEWLEDGMRDEAEIVIEEIDLQLRRAFCREAADRGNARRSGSRG